MTFWQDVKRIARGTSTPAARVVWLNGGPPLWRPPLRSPVSFEEAVADLHVLRQLGSDSARALRLYARAYAAGYVSGRDGFGLDSTVASESYYPKDFVEDGWREGRVDSTDSASS